MPAQNQISQKYLLYEDQQIQPKNATFSTSMHSPTQCPILWSNRLALILNMSKDKTCWHFTAFDFLMNETKQIHYRKSERKSYSFNILPLNEEFGFILEYLSGVKRIIFVRIDWNKNKFEQIEVMEFKECLLTSIIVDKMETSKFIVRWTNDRDRHTNYRSCKLLSNRKIEFGEIYQSITQFHHYSNDKLIRVEKHQIITYTLATKKEEIFETHWDTAMLENVVWCNAYCEWVKDRAYIGAHFPTLNMYGIASVDLEEKRWTLLKGFETSWKIRNFLFSNDNLIVFEKNSCEEVKSKVKVHGISMRRPNHLRKMAWLLVVSVMKKRGEKDSYKLAKEYLPLNSDLREAWFKNEEKKEENVPVKKLKSDDSD